MNFKPELLQAILAGDKTETRRIVKPGESISDSGYMIRDAKGRAKWCCEYRYKAAPGRGKKGIALIEIKSLQLAPLQSMTFDDAMAEGVYYNHPFFYHPLSISNHFSTPLEAFRALWDSINTKAPYRWQDNPNVWVIKFENLGELNTPSSIVLPPIKHEVHLPSGGYLKINVSGVVIERS